MYIILTIIVMMVLLFCLYVNTDIIYGRYLWIIFCCIFSVSYFVVAIGCIFIILFFEGNKLFLKINDAYL